MSEGVVSSHSTSTSGSVTNAGELYAQVVTGANLSGKLCISRCFTGSLMSTAVLARHLLVHIVLSISRACDARTGMLLQGSPAMQNRLPSLSSWRTLGKATPLPVEWDS